MANTIVLEKQVVGQDTVMPTLTEETNNATSTSISNNEGNLIISIKIR